MNNGNISNVNVNVTSTGTQQTIQQLQNVQNALVNISRTPVNINMGNNFSQLNSDIQNINLNTNSMLASTASSFSLLGSSILNFSNRLGGLNSQLIQQQNIMNTSRLASNELLNSIGRLGNNTEDRKAYSNIVNEIQKFEKSFRNAEDAAEGLKENILGIGRNLAGLGAATVLGLTLTGMIVLFKQGIDLTSDWIQEGVKYNTVLENYRIGFSVLGSEIDKVTGQQESWNTSLERADKLMKSLKDYATYSTFTIPNVMEAGQKLMTYGMKEKDTLPMIKLLGDTSRGDPEKFKAQSYAIAQSITAGRLTGDNLRQFREGGFNPLMELAKLEAKTKGGTAEQYMPGLQKDMEDKKIGIDKVILAFQLATEKGGTFYKMQEKMAQTASGKWATILDKFESFRGETTAKIFERYKFLLDDVINILDDLVSKMDPIVEAFDDKLAPAIEDAFNQLLNLTGLADSEDGIQGLVDNTVMWIEVLAVSIDTLMTVGNIAVATFGVFATGLSTIATIIANTDNILLMFTTSFMAAIQIVVFGVAGMVEWAVDKVAHYFSVVFNKLSEEWNKMMKSKMAEHLGISNWTIETRFDEKDPGDFKNSSWDLLQETIKTNEKIMNDAAKEIGDSATFKMTSLFAGITNNAFENLVGKGSQDVINKLSEIKPKPKKKDEDDKRHQFDVTNAISDDTKDAAAAAKKLADAWDDVAKQIDSALSKLVGFDTVFGKMQYENFSPSKLKARMNRYLKELTNWNQNLKELESKGVSSDVIAQLQEQGLAGIGMTKAWNKASPEQLAALQSMYSQVKGQARTSAVGQVIMQHTGEIKILGINSAGELKVVIDYLAKDLIKEKRSNSLLQPTINAFK
jgi:gas vesicle protein